MKVSALQITPFDDVDQLIEANAGSDLYVLPEMWPTGFTTVPQRDAIADHLARERMVQLATSHQAAVAGSIAVQTAEGFRNRFYFATPSGEVSHYDKHHLFTLGGETKHFQAGAERTVVEWRGVRFLLLVCYDLRFPVWARSRGDYDSILYIANWPTLRIEPWRTLLRARAIENQCFVVGVNRVSPETVTVKGKEGIRLFGGRSAIIAPEGTPLTEASADSVEVISAELDMDSLRKMRQKFPVLDDRDRFIIEH